MTQTPRWMLIPLWLMAEVAIVACDLAEVIGSAVALKLLFGLPLWGGVLITGGRGSRHMRAAGGCSKGPRHVPIVGKG